MLVLKRSGSLEQQILSIKNQLVLIKMILVRKNYQTLDHLSWVAFYLVYGLSSPISQFLNGTHEFGELWQEKIVRVRLGLFHLNWPEPVLFGRAERLNGK